MKEIGESRKKEKGKEERAERNKKTKERAEIMERER